MQIVIVLAIKMISNSINNKNKFKTIILLSLKLNHKRKLQRKIYFITLNKKIR